MSVTQQLAVTVPM